MGRKENKEMQMIEFMAQLSKLSPEQKQFIMLLADQVYQERVEKVEKVLQTEMGRELTESMPPKVLEEFKEALISGSEEAIEEFRKKYSK